MSLVRRLTKNARFGRKTLRKAKVLDKVSQGGKVFSVVFTKKDGTERTMSCRRGVKSHLRGGKNTVKHLPQYLTVFSMNDEGYRNINLETLKTVKGCGQVYNF